MHSDGLPEKRLLVVLQPPEELPEAPAPGGAYSPVVVVGNTGAGKSTLLNALLGEASVLPTNGMRVSPPVSILASPSCPCLHSC